MKQGLNGGRWAYSLAGALTILWLAGFGWWVFAAIGEEGLLRLSADRAVALLTSAVAPPALFWALAAMVLVAGRSEDALLRLERRFQALTQPRPELGREFLNVVELLRLRQEAIERVSSTTRAELESVGRAISAQAEETRQSVEATLGRMVIDGEALRGQAADLATQVDRTVSRMEKLDKQGQRVAARVASAIEAAEATLETCTNGIEAAVGRCVETATKTGEHAAETLKQVFVEGRAATEAQHAALTAATNIALLRSDTLKSELHSLALEAEGAVGRVLGQLPERLAEADERALALEQRIDSMTAALTGRIESAFAQGEVRLTRLAELVATLERGGVGANESLGAAVVAVETERKALEASITGASEALGRAGASVKSQGRVAAVTADSVMLKLKQLEVALAQQVQLLERAAQTADRVPLVAAALAVPAEAAGASATIARPVAPAAAPRAPAPAVASQAERPGGEKMDPLSQLRGSITALSELATLLAGVLGDKVEAGLGQASVADRSAALRRLTEQLTQTSGPDSAGVRLYKLPQARLLADKFMTRFERLLRDAGDGNPDDMLPVILLTTDVGKVYLALSKLSSRARAETARAIQ